MSPALQSHIAAGLYKSRTKNRRRHSAARASFRRVTLATITAATLTLATLAVSTLDRWTAESTDRSLAAVARWTTTGQGPLLVRDLENVPTQLNAATRQRWSQRLAAQAHADRVNDWQADEDDIAAADARLMEFVRGTASHVDEADLEIASPSIRARAFEKLD